MHAVHAGPQVTVPDERAEADLVVKRILEARKRDPRPSYDQIAVLTRCNPHLRLLSDRLRKHKQGKLVPFRLSNNTFWDEAEVGVVMCYVRLAVNLGYADMALDMLSLSAASGYVGERCSPSGQPLSKRLPLAHHNQRSFVFL